MTSERVTWNAAPMPTAYMPPPIGDVVLVQFFWHDLPFIAVRVSDSAYQEYGSGGPWGLAHPASMLEAWAKLPRFSYE